MFNLVTSITSDIPTLDPTCIAAPPIWLVLSEPHFSLLFTKGAAEAGEPVPTFGTNYTVSATLHLPYAEIVEPLFAAYDAPNGKSSVKFYNGKALFVIFLRKLHMDIYIE